MRIKHKQSNKDDLKMSVSLEHWQKDYYQNKKYLNYDFFDVPDIYDLFEIDKKTGNLQYLKSGFSNEIIYKVRENPEKYIYKKHDPKYLDEYLMPKNIYYSDLSFLERIKKIWNNIPKLKMIYESIINSTISKVTSNIVIGVIIGVLILIIWAVYKTQLIELWRVYFLYLPTQ